MANNISSFFVSKIVDIPTEFSHETKRPSDCTECINYKHPENCTSKCPILFKNKGRTVKPTSSSDLGGI